MKWSKVRNPGFLLLCAAALVFFAYLPGNWYGSSVDWFAQHVSIAETMRQTILEEGTLLIGQLPLGGGSNIYDFSYYGYLRPDVLLACLMPEVPMEAVITAYAILGYLASVLLFYLLLIKMNCKEKTALLGGMLFLCAACFFHIHRQIMFVNYMPFLLGAMHGVLRYHKTAKKLLPILMMFLIAMHSYYYAISAWLVIYLFLLYTADRKGQQTGRKLWSLTGRYAVWALTAAAMAALLLLPTAASVLSCASTKDSGSAGASPWELHFGFGSLLYSGYGLGLTLIALFLLVLALCIKKIRLLAVGLLFTLVCTAVPLVLNGFLYHRAKILIPFLPLVLVVGMQTLEYFLEQKKRPPLWTLLPVITAAVIQYIKCGIGWIWVDLVLVILVFALIYANAETKKDGGSECLTVSLDVVLTVMCGCLFLYAAAVHNSDDRITKEETRVSSFTKAEREDFYRERSCRFDTLRSPYQSSNCLLAYGAGRTSMYTSTANGSYSTFFYDEIRNPMGDNNRVGLYNRANPFFLYLMGVRYLEATGETLPWGYEIRRQKGNNILAENESVLPVCYGSTRLLSDPEYEKLQFPTNLEALGSCSIVKGDGNTAFLSHFREFFPKEGEDYQIRKESEAVCTVIPETPIKDQILVVTFHVTADSGEEVNISINGVRNKRSADSAPYPNGNDNFTYYLSSPEPITEFTVKTSGKYEISRLHIYSLDTAYLGNPNVYPMTISEEKGAVLSGSITMPEDGYCITSCPIQDGYRAWVDGQECAVETVNRTFVGFPLAAGTHEIRLFYEPPLQKAGMAVSLAGWLLFAGFFLSEAFPREKRFRAGVSWKKVSSCPWKELVSYGIGGVLTTAVNYLVYFGLDRISVNYLAANTLAWVAAVIFSYAVNRNVVFGSRNRWLLEFLNFAGLRLVTLAVENLLLYLAVQQLGISHTVSKLLVSVLTVLANYGICKKRIFRKQE